MNTARGAIVDRDSLVKVMNDGHLGGERQPVDLNPVTFARMTLLLAYPPSCILHAFVLEKPA